MWQRFTNPATRVIHFAQEEAKIQGVGVVGTEHILLGLIREDEGVAARVLQRLGIALEKVREVVERQAPSAHEKQTHRLTLSPRAKKSLEYSLQEARELNPKLGLLDFVDTEHVLLGLLHNTHNESNRAREILHELGFGAALIAQEVLNYMGAQPDAGHFDVERLPLDSSTKRRLTAAAKKALQYAQIEAARLGSNEVAGEHLLMGLVREGGSVAGRALDRLHISLRRLRAMFSEPVSPEAGAWESVEVGPVVEQALARAVEELEDFHVKYGTPLFLDTEHLLLGLLGVRREEGNVALDLLVALQVDPQCVRQEVLSVMGLIAPVSLEETTGPERPNVDVWLSLSEPAFRVLTLAGEEANRQGTNVIDVPHLTLGLLRFNEAALAREGVRLDQAQTMLLDTPAAPGAAAPSLSPQCADVLGLAYQAALKEAPAGALVRITPAHLAQGLLDGAGVFGYDTVRKLTDLGVDLERFKAEL
jgi:ATP-dependent Clp protease ATP-binding subunit ClpA